MIPGSVPDPSPDPPTRPQDGIETAYPIFDEPDRYLACREGRGIRGLLKRWSERRALDRCFEETSGVRGVCDVPCGPGRLFPYWKRRAFRVEALDLSPPMVEAARIRHGELGLAGSVRRADAFAVGEVLAEPPDLIACVRFLYYFKCVERHALLRHLAGATRRYLLLQYKTLETPRGRRHGIHEQRRGGARTFHTNQDILEELERAELRCLRIEAISSASDRAYVLAERLDRGARDDA